MKRLGVTAKLLWVGIYFSASVKGQGLQSDTEKLVTAPPGATLSGEVISSSRAAVQDAFVEISGQTIHASSEVDGLGRFSFRDLKAGSYSLTVTGKSRAYLPNARSVFVTSDTTVTLNMVEFGVICGAVIDGDKVPQPNVAVLLLSRVYVNGRIRLGIDNFAETDDRGKFCLGKVDPGISHFLAAKRLIENVGAISTVSKDPKERQPILTPTFYPSSPTQDGAIAIFVNPGQRLEGQDITMIKSQSLCIEAVLKAQGVPKALSFMLLDEFAGSDAGTTIPINGDSGGDGKIRVCDLRAAEYQLEAVRLDPSHTNAPLLYGKVDINLGDRDLTKLVVDAEPGIVVHGKVKWADAETNDSATVHVIIEPISRPPFLGERPDLQTELPGSFLITGALSGEHHISVAGLPSNTYVKEIQIGGSPSLFGVVEFGSSLSSDLLITVARDAATVGVRVVDRDNKPVSNVSVVLFPREASSIAALSTSVVTAITDDNGSASFAGLQPNQYVLLATSLRIAQTPEALGKLWGLRSQGTEVTLSPKASSSVVCKLLSLE